MTTGLINLPGYYKEWAGADGKSRDNPYWMTLNAAVDTSWLHSTGVSVSSHLGTGAGLLGFNYPAPITDGDVLDRLSNRLHSQKFNMGMFLGEGREALSMITDSAKRLSDATTSFQHGNAKGVLKALGVTPVGKALSATAKALSAGFLAWNFGWKPVLSDMHTGAEALGHLVESDPSARNWQRVTIIRRGPAIMAGGHGQGYIEIGRMLKTMHSLSYDDEVKESLSLNDPLSLAYDLVPLSFVLNFALPVGNYLDRLHTASVFNGHVAVDTTWTRTSIQIGSFNADLGGFDGVWVGNYRSRSMVMNRSVSQGLLLDVAAPTLQIPSSLFQATTVTSLLLQKLLK